ncbi:MAG TPA: PAS domain S-box protein [Opitutaceae bacterium]|nr:PAS domain S-box protein [Opitutaceae bacterium]
MNETQSKTSPHPTDAFLAAIVNASSDAIISEDLEGRVTSWNAAAEKIFGYARDEIVGRPIALLWPAANVPREMEIMARVKRGELVAHYETQRRRKDGTEVAVSLTASPICGGEGEIVGVSKIIRDVTAQREADDRLRRNEERWRMTLASIGDGVIATDAEGRVNFMNQVAETLTGWTAEEAGGRSVEEVFAIVNETTRRKVENPVKKVLRLARTVGLANHTMLIARDGIERPIDDSGAPIRDPDGRVAGVVLVFRDVSVRRAADLAARRLASIVEDSEDAIVGKNLKGIVQSWNKGAERLFGYTGEEMIGQSILRVIPPDRWEEEQQILARLQRGERVHHFETIRRHKNGGQLQVSLTISPIRDSEGHIVGASKIARDISERRRADDALRAAQKQLEEHAQDLEAKVRERTARIQETMAELEAFSYSLSHDMRAPLRSIQSFSEIVLADYADKLDETAKSHLQRVVNAAARMDRLIQDVLAFSRVSRQEITVEPVDVEKLMREVIQERPELQPPHAEIAIESPLLFVRGHEASLTQCLTNLLDNAVKFVPRGVAPRVRVRTEALDGRVRLWVEDNGIGIDPAAQRRLFLLFERVHAGATYRGTGIGLAIVRKAVERMGGTAGVESQPGQGSRFWIELPAANP